MLRFPDAFRWGVAVSSHQVEGQNEQNNWAAWEKQPGRIYQGQRAGRACDWWENPLPDLDRAADLGLNALRLSVEWSRIEPAPGQFAPAALERYAALLRELRRRGLEPMVTLHHFTDPCWLGREGGWENPTTVERFARFVRHTVEALGEHCDLWCTVNEPNVYAYMGYVEGVFPPGKSDLGLAMRVLRHLLLGHAAAYREVHALQPNARVGFAHNVRPLDPARPRAPGDRLVTAIADRFYNQAILTALLEGRWSLPLGLGAAPDLQGTLDWIGLNYYTRDLVRFTPGRPRSLFIERGHAENAELLDGGYGEFYPEGLYRCLQRLAAFGRPLYVTENGIPDDDDDQRPRYLVGHLAQVGRALLHGCPVRGYYHWTLVDNFEWAAGWSLRFGLIALDPETQERTPRPSAALYRQIVRAKGIPPDLLDAYLPELRGRKPALTQRRPARR